MKVSSCPGCGDTHLCAGTRGHTGPTLVQQVHRFATDTFTAEPLGVVGTAAAWDAYLTWCAANEQAPFSQRRFVQAMAETPGIRRVKRSTMRFVGITWRGTGTRGRHAAPEPSEVRDLPVRQLL